MFNKLFLISFALLIVNINACKLRNLQSVDPAACTAVENNIDYFGNDLINVNSPKSDGCCEKCRDYPGCRAWTWTNTNGGTCWLKSSSGDKKVTKDGAVSSVLIDKTPVCSFEYDIDYVGNDIGNQLGSSPSQCCLICKNFKGCAAFTWSNYLGGTCWLKSGKGNTILKTGVVSSVSSYLPTTCDVVEKGKDYVGNDIGNVPGSDSTKCCQACATFIGCKAWSWSNHNGGTCWLKSGKGLSVDNPSVTSWTNGLPTTKCTSEVDVDYVDNDIANVQGSIDTCCQKCKDNINCKAWSWSNYLGGTCWLKSKKDKTVVSKGVTSGVFV